MSYVLAVISVTVSLTMIAAFVRGEYRRHKARYSADREWIKRIDADRDRLTKDFDEAWKMCEAYSAQLKDFSESRCNEEYALDLALRMLAIAEKDAESRDRTRTKSGREGLAAKIGAAARLVQACRDGEAPKRPTEEDR